jgi:hypothetical protein
MYRRSHIPISAFSANPQSIAEPTIPKEMPARARGKIAANDGRICPGSFPSSGIPGRR